MVTAIILMKVQRDQINFVAQKLVEFDGISEVYSVSGQYDLVAIVRVANNDGLANLVTKKMIYLPGIQATETLLAFQAYSRHDLASMFSIGLEE
jgi:DNA-binding Lrp family transcriptional regulator